MLRREWIGREGGGRREGGRERGGIFVERERQREKERKGCREIRRVDGREGGGKVKSGGRKICTCSN